MPCFFKAGPTERISPGAGARGGHSQDGGGYSVWFVRVPPHAFRSTQRWTNFSAHDGRDSGRIGLLLCVLRRHLGGKQICGGAPDTSAGDFVETAEAWASSECREV